MTDQEQRAAASAGANPEPSTAKVIVEEVVRFMDRIHAIEGLPPAAPLRLKVEPDGSISRISGGPLEEPIETGAQGGPSLDVERGGWWHPAECSNEHNEHGNCLAEDGAVVGWRDPIVYARIGAAREGPE